MNLLHLCPFRALAVACALALGTAGAAHACTNPTGVEGQNRFDSASKRMVFCNGTSWVASGGPTEAISNTNSGIVATSGGTISLTLGGTAGAAYIHPTAGFVGPSVSATTAPLKSFTPVSGNDVATKDYVDSAVAGASGGGGVSCATTRTTHTGNLGGVSGANSICSSAFGTGWRFATVGAALSGFNIVNASFASWIDGAGADCSNWTVGDTSYSGNRLAAASQTSFNNIVTNCSSSAPLVCCKF